jgi:hypothetical protein
MDVDGRPTSGRASRSISNRASRMGTKSEGHSEYGETSGIASPGTQVSNRLRTPEHRTVTSDVVKSNPTL